MKTTPHRNGRRYTTDELRMLMKMWEDGSEVGEIATALQTTIKGVLKMTTRLRHDGVPLSRRNKGTKEGRSGRLWTQEEVEYLFRRRLAGDTAEAIARDLDRTYSGVTGMINNLRKAGAPIAMLGQGVKRLWSPEALKEAAVGRFDEGAIESAENLPN